MLSAITTSVERQISRRVLYAQLTIHTITRSRSTTDADQSCAQCGAQGIQLIPLQKEVRMASHPCALLPVSDTPMLHSWSRPCLNGSVLCHKAWTL